MLICGPIKPRDPAHAARLAGLYLDWINGRRSTPPAPLRQAPDDAATRRALEALQTPAAVPPHLAPPPKRPASAGGSLAGLAGKRRERRRTLDGPDVALLATPAHVLHDLAAHEFDFQAPPELIAGGVNVGPSNPPGEGGVEAGRVTPSVYGGRSRKPVYVDVFGVAFDPNRELTFDGYPWSRDAISLTNVWCYEVPTNVGDPIPGPTFSPVRNLITALYNGPAGIEQWRNDQTGPQNNEELYFSELAGRVELAIVCTAGIRELPWTELRMVFADTEYMPPWTRFVDHLAPGGIANVDTPFFTNYANALKLTRPPTLAMSSTEFTAYARSEYLRVTKRFYDVLNAAAAKVVPDALRGIYAAPPQSYWMNADWAFQGAAHAAARAAARAQFRDEDLAIDAANIVRDWHCVMGSVYLPYKSLTPFTGQPYGQAAVDLAQYVDESLDLCQAFAATTGLPLCLWFNAQYAADAGNPYRLEALDAANWDPVWSRISAMDPLPRALAFFADVSAVQPNGPTLDAWMTGTLAPDLLDLNFNP
jgi:hypothetical protein